MEWIHPSSSERARGQGWIGRQTVDEVIDGSTIEPLGIAQRTDLGEAKLIDESLTVEIAGRNAHADARELELIEGVSENDFATLRHDASALRLGYEPPARVCHAVSPVDSVMTNHSDESPGRPDARAECLRFFVLAQTSGDEVFRIAKLLGAVHPGEPLTQIGAIRLHHSEEGFCVRELQQAQFEIGSDFVSKHQAAIISVD